MSGAYRRTHALSQPCVHPSRSSVQSAGRRDESIREHSLSGHSVSLRQKVLKVAAAQVARQLMKRPRDPAGSGTGDRTGRMHRASLIAIFCDCFCGSGIRLLATITAAGLLWRPLVVVSIRHRLLG